MLRSRALLPTLLLLGAVACSGTSSESSSDVTERGEITVFAASSLTDAFTALGEDFMAANPTVKVAFNFAGSSELSTQILQGAPADVFAAADTSTMSKLTSAGGAGSDPVVFATNRAQIIVAAGNPRSISGLADLANSDLANSDLVVIGCSPDVPCGRYGKQILEQAGVDVTLRSLEENVRAVVTKVTLGEADAGIVYVTDVIAAGDSATGVDIPADVNVIAEYPIVVTGVSPNPLIARAFVDFVLSPRGQEILASFGFLAP